MILELFLLFLPFLLMKWNEINESMKNIWNIAGNMSFWECSFLQVISFLVRRTYNAYLEYIYFQFPKYQTQGNMKNENYNTTCNSSQEKDTIEPCGRNQEQLTCLNYHEKLTIISQFLLTYVLYFGLPGFYPSITRESSFLIPFLRFIGHQYILAFGMYWSHKCLHDVYFLWKYIHSIHHYAKHPLSRTTYEDHWLDNFLNAIVGRVFAQILLPINHTWFWISTIIRIMESLEKHSGISCSFNIIHTFCKNIFPYVQMPHHHDYHHEGFKSSNFTFTSLGGLWDCLFGTRRIGRYSANNYTSTTRFDYKMSEYKQKYNKHKIGIFHLSFKIHPLIPMGLLTLLVFWKLNNMNYVIAP